MESIKKYLILDLGSQHVKAGYSGEGYPRFILPSVVGYKYNPDDPPLVAYDALYVDDIKLVYPFQEKTVTENVDWDWDAAKELISGIVKQLNIEPSEYFVLYIEPMHSGSRNTNKLVEFLKEKFYFPQVFVYKQSHLTLQEMHCQSALIIELGHSISTIVAYYKGFELEPTKTFFLIGGRLVAEKWAKQLERELGTRVSTYELVRIIDKYFYIAKNYEQEVENYKRGKLKDIDVNLPFARKSVVIKDERFNIPEAIFKPDILGHSLDGFSKSLDDAISACPIDTRPEILDNVILSGGLSKLNGLEDRIKSEIQRMFPNLEINIRTHQKREMTAWIGADALCTNKIAENKPTNKRFLGFTIPDVVHQLYNEAIRCEEAKLWLATSIMIKKAIEMMIIDLNKQETSVFNILIRFRNYGIITEDLLEWANSLEIFKNLNAPPMMKKISKSQATEELDFLQALLEIIYSIRAKLDDHIEQKQPTISRK